MTPTLAMLDYGEFRRDCTCGGANSSFRHILTKGDKHNPLCPIIPKPKLGTGWRLLRAWEIDPRSSDRYEFGFTHAEDWVCDQNRGALFMWSPTSGWSLVAS